MLNAIPDVAQKWRAISARFGVPIATTIYINMDNAGDHGTGNAIDTYTTRCLEELNVKIEFQPSKSPDMYSNDTGFYNSLQQKVEKNLC